jgi:periplasmic mercuric ion binding protein
MKSLKIFAVVAVCMALTTTSFSQKAKTEAFKVSGECGMCKKKIEKAAKEAGASFASWNIQTKVLKVSYNTTAASTSSIQQRIADAGYDTPGFKATDEAYNKLDACCQYDREVKKEINCCASGCEMMDGKCKDEAACKEKGCCKNSGTDKKSNCCSSEKTTANATHSH